jgi:pimeloyl-ACP methyl ester carboxylesterase
MNDSRFAIIFVPGIRPKPPVAQHAMQLGRCLQTGLLRAGCPADRAAELIAEFELAGWSRQFYGVDGDISPDLEAIDRLLAGRDSVAVDKLASQSLSLRINSILYAIGDRFPLLTKLFGTRLMRSRVRDIQQYFTDWNGTGTAARAIVIDALRRAWGRGQKVLLVAHSFGSVIAYDALWQLSRQHGDPGRVELLLSMGSPLTMRYIRRRLLGARRRGAERYPANIRYWANVASIGEATALDRRLAVCFAEMLRLGLVERIDDNLQLVNQFHGPAGLNVHKCFGYLANPEVARQLLTAIDREQG